MHSFTHSWVGKIYLHAWWKHAKQQLHANRNCFISVLVSFEMSEPATHHFQLCNNFILCACVCGMNHDYGIIDTIIIAVSKLCDS